MNTHAMHDTTPNVASYGSLGYRLAPSRAVEADLVRRQPSVHSSAWREVAQRLDAVFAACPDGVTISGDGLATPTRGFVVALPLMHVPGYRVVPSTHYGAEWVVAPQEAQTAEQRWPTTLGGQVTAIHALLRYQRWLGAWNCDGHMCVEPAVVFLRELDAVRRARHWNQRAYYDVARECVRSVDDGKEFGA